MRGLSWSKHAPVVALLAIPAVGGMNPPDSRAPFSGLLFGTSASGGTLLRIDPATGGAVVVGPMGFSAPALALDPTTGVMYAGQGAGAPLLYTVDPTSGATALVGDTGMGFAATGGLDFRADGTLFAAVNILGDGATGSDHLATFDTTTGVATIIGPFGTILVPGPYPADGTGSASIEGIEGIAFDASGTLWGSSSTRGVAGPDSALFTIDTTTGAATFVATIADSLATSPSGGVVSLQFRDDGTLFGGTATAVAPATDGGFLITIDTSSGLFSFVGGASATGGSSLGGLADSPSPCLSPASATTSYNGTGINDQVLTAGQAIVPGTWTATVTPVGHAPGMVSILLRGTALATGPIFSISGGPPTELLVAPPFYLNLGPLPHAGGPVMFSAAVPNSAALCGVPWAAQAVVTGGFVDLSNGVSGVTGY